MKLRNRARLIANAIRQPLSIPRRTCVRIALLARLVGNVFITHEGDLGAVGGPTGNVEGALAAEEGGEDLGFPVCERHQVHGYVLVGGVAGCAFFVAEEDHPSAVGRDVGKPVGGVGGEDLLGVGAVGVHTTDVHPSTALGVEVDPLAVGGVVGAVVDAGVGGEAVLLAAGRGDGIDVGVVVARGGEGDGLAVRREAVPIGRRDGGDLLRRSSGEGGGVDECLALHSGISDGERGAVGREAVVVVAVDLRAGGNTRGRAAGKGQPV